MYRPPSNATSLTAALALGALLAIVPWSGAWGKNKWIEDWQSLYVDSHSDDNVITGSATDCQLCHVQIFGGGDNFNGYGWDIKVELDRGASLIEAFVAIEGLDSDMDPTGSTNLEEINADTQPGWREGSNTVYDKDGVTSTVDAPTNIGPLDPSTSPEPDINLMPVALDFGTVDISEMAVLTTQVQNPGTADLVVGDVLRCAGTSSEYDWSPAAPFTVMPGGGLTLSVTYAPTDAGLDVGCLELASNDPDEPTVTLDLTATGTAAPEPDIHLDPAALNFGSLLVGDSASLTTNIENLGTADLQVSMIDLCAGTSAEFSWMPSAPFSVATGSSQTLTITYAPADAGVDAGCLEISSNDPDESSALLDLAGSGMEPPTEPDIDLEPTALDFGTVLIGEPADLAAEVRNLGTADLQVSMIDLCAGTSAEFSWTPSAPFSVAPGGSQTLTVAYAPADVGADAGCLELSSNDPDESSISLDVTGTGEDPLAEEPNIQLDPTGLDFGTVFLGGSSTLTAQIHNLGNADLQVTIIDLCAGTSVEYDWSPDAPFAVAPGSSQTLSVTYTPVDMGMDVGCLEIWSNDPDAPTVELGVDGYGTEEPVVLVDLDIVAFRSKKRVKLGNGSGAQSSHAQGKRTEKNKASSVKIQLVVKNAGTFDEPRPATVIGEQNGVVVYNETGLVGDGIGKRRQRYEFPSYTPETAGDILWTATLVDDDPDVDEATAVTRVMP